jgi:transcriptional regulator with XRE-family HTH domain
MLEVIFPIGDVHIARTCRKARLMSATASPARNCDRCGARLAGYNRGPRCAPCSSPRGLRVPPAVPREFWDAPEMRNALATWHMGRVIFAYRHHPWHQRTLGQSAVGRWFGLTQTQLSRIENGRAPEEMSKLIRWAKLLGMPSELLWFKVPSGADTAMSTTAAPNGQLVDHEGHSASGPVTSEETVSRGMPRRDFVLLASAVTSLLDVLRGVSPDLPERITHGSRVDSEAAAGLESVMLGYRQIYQSVGATSLLDPVCGTLRLLTELTPGAGAYRGLIVSLIGQAGSLAATMLMLDQGDFIAASRYLAIAASAAQQSDDQELLAITMAVRAFHSAYGGDPADGLAFAREAVGIASAGVHPKTFGWVSAVESEMHATLGDEASYQRALESAARQITGPMPDRQWKGIGAFNEAKLTAYRGGGLMRLRRYGDAQRVLVEALSQLDPVQAKHRCTAHIDLADAFARDRKPDEAAHHAISALDIITVTGHAESMRRVAGVYKQVRPTGIAAARELRSRLLEVRAGA